MAKRKAPEPKEEVVVSVVMVTFQKVRRAKRDVPICLDLVRELFQENPGFRKLLLSSMRHPEGKEFASPSDNNDSVH